jgi:hypothetical protein
MSRDASLSDLVKAIEHSLEDVKKPPRTFAERMLASGENFILAIAFFALGFTANVVVAQDVPNSLAVISAFVGLVGIKLWAIAREHESMREELNNLARDARLAAMIVELTVEALAKRPRASGGSNDSSGGGDSEAVPTVQSSHT